MFNGAAFNRSAFNRRAENGNNTLWRGIGEAVSSATAAVWVIRSLDGQAEAVFSGDAIITVIGKVNGSAEAEAGATSTLVRVRQMGGGRADAEAFATAGGLYSVGSEFLQFDEVIPAGAEIVIDTGRMTVAVNNQNAVYILSDDSTFFSLSKGDTLTISGSGLAAITLLWKDRWI